MPKSSPSRARSNRANNRSPKQRYSEQDTNRTAVPGNRQKDVRRRKATSNRQRGDRTTTAATMAMTQANSNALTSNKCDDSEIQSTAMPPGGNSVVDDAPREDIDNTKKLEDELWYHGLIARDDMPRLVKRHGDFLVRYTELDDKSKSYVLSVMCNGHIRHLVIEQAKHVAGTRFFMHTGRKFDTVRDLIAHYNSTPPRPLDGDVVLIKAINRDQWELAHTQLVMGKKLGEGAFGIVYAGRLKLPGIAQGVQVAIKEAHKDVPMDKATKDELMHEARIMFQNKHRNIVTIYGVAATQPPICIVMELIKGGTLKDYVEQKTDIAQSELARYCHHAAAGLKFLHEQNVVHRDVAARNCLILLASGTHTHHTVKLSDFGLAKGIKGEEKLVETLRRRTFNKSSDVWAFGVLMWEVFSKGEDPYPSCETLKEVMVLVKSGGHMSKRDCEQVPSLVNELMLRCWVPDSGARPDMGLVKVELKAVHYQYVNSEKTTNKKTRR